MSNYKDAYMKYKNKYMKIKNIDGGNKDLEVKQFVQFYNQLNSYNKSIIQCHLLKKDDILYLLVGEDHYKFMQYNKYPEVKSLIIDFFDKYKPNIYIERPLNKNNDLKLYDEFMKQYDVGFNVSDQKSLLEIIDNDTSIAKTNFDIRNDITSLYDDIQIHNLENLILNVLAVVKPSNDKNYDLDELCNEIVNIIENLTIKKNIVYLLKNKNMYTNNPIILKLYTNLLDEIGKSHKQLLDHIIDLRNDERAQLNPNLIDKYFFEQGAKITDLYLFTLLLKNKDKFNVVVGGIAHINNINNFLLSQGFKPSST